MYWIANSFVVTMLEPSLHNVGPRRAVERQYLAALNQRPPEPHSGADASQVASNKQVGTISTTVCTSVCTDEGRTEQADPLAALASALLGLSPTDRARLAAMLLGEQPERKAGEKAP
jgi:hypothetical protein